jgi:hypothetical protein
VSCLKVKLTVSFSSFSGSDKREAMRKKKGLKNPERLGAPASGLRVVAVLPLPLFSRIWRVSRFNLLLALNLF